MEMTWQSKCIVLVTLCTDWKVGFGTRKPTIQDMRRGEVIQHEAYLNGTDETKLELAHHARFSDMAVFNYGDVLTNKGKAKELYRVTREDYQAYLALPDLS